MLMMFMNTTPERLNPYIYQEPDELKPLNLLGTAFQKLLINFQFLSETKFRPIHLKQLKNMRKNL